MVFEICKSKNMYMGKINVIKRKRKLIGDLLIIIRIRIEMVYDIVIFFIKFFFIVII